MYMMYVYILKNYISQSSHRDEFLRKSVYFLYRMPLMLSMALGGLNSLFTVKLLFLSGCRYFQSMSTLED